MARNLGKTKVTRREFIRESGISQRQVLKLFNSWNDLVRAANLTPIDRSRIDDDTLMEAMYQTLLKEKSIPAFHIFENHCEYDSTIYRRRWGTWKKILVVFRKWVNEKHPDFPLISYLSALEENGVDSIGDNVPISGSKTQQSCRNLAVGYTGMYSTFAGYNTLRLTNKE